MANLSSHQALYHYLRDLIEQHIVTEDDALVFDAFQRNDIRHACQAIREAQSGEVEYQHLTLRFGSQGEQSVYQFELSEPMTFCLDLYSLYLALRQSRFQMETFHPDLISNVVVPIRADALLWPAGALFLDQILQFHRAAFAHVVPSVQINFANPLHPGLDELVEQVRENAYALWFELYTAAENFEQIARYKPDMLKLAVSLENKEDRSAFLPIVRFLRQHRFKWVAGRVASQTELNQYKLLGASYYFGYFSDIPTSLSFKTFDEADNDSW
ncbi:EAL domain-containing protein [Vibrio fluvialis]|uniref:EAL domain-containing protein n=1 Tax=Vibrio fluvialis TaxID=676 RepID=UPI0015583AF1|nr:EAL domain-containing protein [Vibrio fluvialis]EKO3415936.1 EAL domain-containing protein [Vibrio fluvialis]EKO3502730.1 EAL domain-containing protein [Vibrio fluvialis]EKO3954570.1 EAL domain-containing protein [Vibrio fluvialis]EKO3958286.1 EAL domain-containing protein [Vibrio fluvialis]ELC0658884.1 EAL domain-containing protein [Vibrio fluvialis]